MDVYAWLLVAVMGIGIISNFFPLVPSVWLIFGSVLIYGFFDSWNAYPVWYVVVLGIVAVGSSFLGRYSTAISKKFGTTDVASLGSNIGTIIGNFLGRAHTGVIGGIFGTIAAEYKNYQSMDDALRAGAGSFIGTAVVAVIKLVISLIIFCITFVLLWRAA